MPVTSPSALQDAEYIGSWFTVELDNGITGNFTDASGLAIDVAVVEKTDTDAKGDTMTRRRPGTVSYGEIALKRTLTKDKKFWEWAKSIRDGKKDFRTKGAIVLHDIAGTEMGRWTFENAWPSKWSASDLDVGSDDLIVEEVTLQIELLVRES
jgi:phage tail-like protein